MKQINYIEIGQNIRKIRKSRGFSQEQLAEKIYISVTHMSHIETGNTKLSLPVLINLADELNVKCDDLVSGYSERSKCEYINELSDIVSQCSPAELKVLIDVLKATKSAIKLYISNDD